MPYHEGKNPAASAAMVSPVDRRPHTREACPMTNSTSHAEIERFLRLAMDEAETAARSGNHSYGAVIVSPDGEIVATGRNQIHDTHDPSSHAEMNAVRAACMKLGTLSLEGYRLYTNGAPCTMCATAIMATRVSEVWYSAPPSPDRTMPTLEAMIAQSGATVPKVHQGILADEASAQIAKWSGTSVLPTETDE
jgi:tRNA(adenine34) deaminase